MLDRFYYNYKENTEGGSRPEGNGRQAEIDRTGNSRTHEQGIDKGLLTLIHQRLDAGSSAKEVETMLLRAGIFHADTVKAMRVALQKYSAHSSRGKYASSEVIDYEFLPPLMKKLKRPEAPLYDDFELEENPRDVHYEYRKPDDLVDHPRHKDTRPIYRTLKPQESLIAQAIDEEVTHKGLFRGRLRRKEFIFGLLFFIGMAFLYMTSVSMWLQILQPELLNTISIFISRDVFGVWLIFIPFIFAPMTIMIISIITRRLHNLELPGWIAWLYLLFFVTPLPGVAGYSLLALDGALALLFIVLLAKKAHPAPNKHGALPSSHGSIFKKIFGYEHIGYASHKK